MQTLQRTAILCFAFVLSLSCLAQHKSPLATYIKEDAPVLVLDHVRVIDGTGAAPQDDMRIVIAGGRSLLCRMPSHTLTILRMQRSWT